MYITNQQRVTGAFCGLMWIVWGIDNKAKHDMYMAKLLDINLRYGDNYAAADQKIAEFIALKNEIIGRMPVVKTVKMPYKDSEPVDFDSDDAPF